MSMVLDRGRRRIPVLVFGFVAAAFFLAIIQGGRAPERIGALTLARIRPEGRIPATCPLYLASRGDFLRERAGASASS